MSRRLVAAAHLVASLGVVPAGAEWLVLRDGARLEIAGAPRVEGRRVLFTTPQGTLAAPRRADHPLQIPEELVAAPFFSLTTR